MLLDELQKLSLQYRSQQRFDKERHILLQGAKSFPHDPYIQERLTWHQRPTFHRDPRHSQTQPRPPLHLSRIPALTPTNHTLSKLCFVTGISSNHPYFELAIQLLESVKATLYYNNIPIKVLDCGLTPEDATYLVQRFNVEVKDPGWDVPQHLLRANSSYWKLPPAGYKGIISRPYIHKHFPGFEYYYWMDADTWIQSELGIDQFVKMAETHGMGVVNHPLHKTWKYRSTHFGGTLPDYCHFDPNTKAILGGHYCINIQMAERYAALCDQLIVDKKQYSWGFDLASLNYFYYHDAKIPAPILDNEDLFYLPYHASCPAEIKNGALYHQGALIKIIDIGPFKNFMPQLQYRTPINAGGPLNQLKSFLSNEEMLFQKNWDIGSFFYRIYE